MSQGWHFEDIKAAIRKSGTTLSALSLQHGYSVGVMRRALKHPHRQAERIIADHLGVPVQELWPDRYPGITQSLHGDSDTPKSRRPAMQKQDAA